MKLIEEHIDKHLLDFKGSENNEFFKSVFESLVSSNKDELRSLLQYVLKILALSFDESNNGLKTIHIHFQNEFEKPIKTLIVEFLWNVFNNRCLHSDNGTDENIALIAKIKEIENVLRREIIAPSNNDRRKFNRIISNRKKLRKALSFYRKLPKTASLRPNTLINFKINQESDVSLCFEDNPFYLHIQSLSNVNSYVLINVEPFNSISKIRIGDIPVFKQIENIILYDCEDRVQRFSQFNTQQLENLNQRHGTNFKNYLIITFGTNYQSVNIIRNKIESIKERFKIPINSSYTILSSEINFLLTKNKFSFVQVNFLGSETSTFWDTFLLETSIRDLYELRSIKLMNIYSVCISKEIKEYIIEELFSNRESSELITSSTKSAILEFSEESIKLLKESLSLTLDLIINSEIKEKIIERLSNTSSIFLDGSIIRSIKLKSYLEKALEIAKTIKLKSWSEFTIDGLSSSIILSYRDQGKYPNYFYPNLIESQFQGNINAIAILPKLFFANHYSWANFNLLKDYHKHLTHPIRDSHFKWTELKKLIQAKKPESNLLIDWNLETEYSSSENRETYKVKLFNQRAKTYNSSDFLIFTESNSEKPRIERVKWFFENVDFDETKYKIQKLDELLEEFNPAERLIDTTQQEKELEIIRRQLGLENESAGRIWKVLLRKKSELIGVDSLYEELKRIFSKNNISLVKQSYFINSWLNTESDTLMPRGNKVVKVLFEYLSLSSNYRLILYRLKNASISGKIEATKKYSSLLKDLFADGCFDANISLESILQHKIKQYQKNHSLEELGIDSEAPLSGLATLKELIQPELNLLELETIEKIKQ